MKNYRHKFPFRIGTVSYIKRYDNNSLLENVRYLQGSFDIVQLLLYSREYSSGILSSGVSGELHRISADSGVSYLVHLPVDLDLLNPDWPEVMKSADLILEIIGAFQDLATDGYVLHIDRSENYRYFPVYPDNRTLDHFSRVVKYLEERLESEADLIYIENTAYDLTYFKDPIFQSNMSICLDMGHLYFYGNQLDQFIESFGSRIRTVHLHGYTEAEDHLALPVIEGDAHKEIASYLHTYTGIVIVEVFNESDLLESMEYLAGLALI